MSFQAEVLNVLIASPGDVAKQRDEIEAAIYERNSMYAENMKVILLPRRWEKRLLVNLLNRQQCYCV